jgi:hypothetical protein
MYDCINLSLVINPGVVKGLYFFFKNTRILIRLGINQSYLSIFRGIL